MKIEFTMRLCDVVRLHDALRDAVDVAKSQDEETAESVLGFVYGAVQLALHKAEHDLDNIALAPNEAEIAMYRAGQRIQAIQALRARTGGGLRETKGAMERAALTALS